MVTVSFCLFALLPFFTNSYQYFGPEIKDVLQKKVLLSISPLLLLYLLWVTGKNKHPASILMRVDILPVLLGTESVSAALPITICLSFGEQGHAGD